MSDDGAEEHIKCINIAQRARTDGDLAKSKRFLQKSLNIQKTHLAESLLSQVEAELAGGASPSSPSSTHSSSSSSSSSSSAPRSRKPEASSGAGGGAASSASAGGVHEGKSFTQEERAAAIRIKSLKGYYEILSVTKEATEQEIKSSYRKMALKFHPDKNHAPEAEEAFKKVSAAYACLSDAKKRQYYDRYGEDPTQRGAGRTSETAGGGPGFGAEDGFEAQDITPEEMFNMFFNVNGGRRMYSRRRYYTGGMNGRRADAHAEEGEQPARHPFAQLAHFLPLILLFLFSFANAPSYSESAPFSLDKTGAYSIRRTTESEIPYFVTRSFQSSYGRDYRAIAQVESMVEAAFYKQTEERCHNEKAEQKRMMTEARKTKGPDQAEKLHQAQAMQLPNCEKLRDLGGA
jgi:DnaJ family protein B protein 12